MIFVKRKQFPVGQGGLHAEVVKFGHEKVVMVYDCGSISRRRSNKKPIEREIDQLRAYVGEDKKEIDYLILSHLHEDHINGMAYLKREGWKVKHLILPYTTPQEKIFYAAGLSANDAEVDLSSFVLNPGGYFEDCVLVEVGQEAEGRGDIADEDGLPRLAGRRGQIAQGAYATTKSQYGWGVALFNYRNRQIAIWIEQNFHDVLPTQFDKWSEDQKGKAVKAYKAALSCFGKNDFNLTSLCVYSGCLIDCVCGASTRRGRCFYGRGSDSHGWIHTGDILLKGDCLQEFTTFFSSYFNRAGVVQVPHHGSKSGYDPILNAQPNKISVVCVGEHNGYRLPNVNVLHQVQLNSGNLIFVTDNQGTAYEEAMRYNC